MIHSKYNFGDKVLVPDYDITTAVIIGIEMTDTSNSSGWNKTFVDIDEFINSQDTYQYMVAYRETDMDHVEIGWYYEKYLKRV